MRQLLANAPADRAWRRRGYLALCRAYPDRVRRKQARNVTDHADRARTEASGCHGDFEGCDVDETNTGAWATVVAKVVRLQEEDTFEVGELSRRSNIQSPRMSPHVEFSVG